MKETSVKSSQPLTVIFFKMNPLIIYFRINKVRVICFKVSLKKEHLQQDDWNQFEQMFSFEGSNINPIKTFIRALMLSDSQNRKNKLCKIITHLFERLLYYTIVSDVFTNGQSKCDNCRVSRAIRRCVLALTALSEKNISIFK